MQRLGIALGVATSVVALAAAQAGAQRSTPIASVELSGGEVGIHRATAKGAVLHLKSVEDFSGNYVAADVGATAGGGAGTTITRNQNGVVIELFSTTQGASLKLAASGIRFTVEK